MKSSILFIILAVLVSCGRPHSNDQESNEVKVRKRLGTLSKDYEEVIGAYEGTLELYEDGSTYKISMDIRTVQDVDPSTDLPLKPRIIGSVFIYNASRVKSNLIASYGVTNGSFDTNSNLLALDISDTLGIRGLATFNTISGVMHSKIKGDIGKIELTRK